MLTAITLRGSVPLHYPADKMGSSDVPPPVAASLTLWDYLARSDKALELADLVALNLAVAKEIPSLQHLDIARYCRVVDGWTEQFRRELPAMERRFYATPQNWKSDIRFFRVGMLQGFLGHVVGIKYIEEQKHAVSVKYTNASDLFLNGLIDTRQWTCGSMAALHVAIARRLGWPVSLACVASHFLSRFDDGEVVHNIEATSTHPGAFASDPDEEYMRRFRLPKRAIECGSDLRKLTTREMIGAFLSLRGRHYFDVRDFERADTSYSLSRVLFPEYRRPFISAMIPLLRRGAALFDREEVGHPDSFFEDLAPVFSPHIYKSSLLSSGLSVHLYQPMGVGKGCVEIPPNPSPFG